MSRLSTVSAAMVAFSFAVIVTLVHYVVASGSGDFGSPDGGWSTAVRVVLIALLAIAMGIDIARYYGKGLFESCRKISRGKPVVFGVFAYVSVAVISGFVVICATAALLFIEFVIWFAYHSALTVLERL